MANAAEKVYQLIQSTVEAQGVHLWDVRFLKEGASWYLRVYIDKPGGITIDDCTQVSHAIDPVIDQADPIDLSYYLEVCSPGVERELTRPQHYEQFVGQKFEKRRHIHFAHVGYRRAEGGKLLVFQLLTQGVKDLVSHRRTPFGK